MTKRIKLLHLTVVGKDVTPASVAFGDKLTVVHGASDTGKSHIFDLVNYALGLSKGIDVPPEGKGYQYVHLGISSEDEGTLTLMRDLEGGAIGVLGSDSRELQNQPAPRYLKANHTTKDPNSASRYLLDRIDLDNQLVRRNQNNVTRMLQLRDVFRLSAVDEEKILSKKSPIEFGQHTDKPVEAAIFRLFIEGKDDSGLVEVPKKEDLQKIAANKVEILDSVISGLESQLIDVPSVDELHAQLARLNSTLIKATSEVEGATARRDGLVLERSQLSQNLAHANERLDEISNLIARFSLLSEQYQSDLGRLDMLAQASETFGFMSGAECPFCGAAPDHQHWPHFYETDTDSPDFLAAVESERAKVTVLRVDLAQTLSSLDNELEQVKNDRSTLHTAISRLTAEIHTSEQVLNSPETDLARLVETRSSIEKSIHTYSQFYELLSLRNSVSQVERPKTSADVPIASSDLNRFDLVAQEILAEWQFANEGSVHFSLKERDIVVDQRPRKSRGKGVRSILHALFNVSLAEYCFRNERRHPGFVLLDSPVVTYRQPDEPERSGEEETITTSVVDAFYSYLQNEFSGQAIILENKSPVSPLPPGSQEYFFGGSGQDRSRAGFYPLHA